MAAIFKREVKAYYTGMIGYVTAAVSLFFLGPKTERRIFTFLNKIGDK